jgi:hypothetical protein
MNRRSELVLRVLALVFGLAWLAGMIILLGANTSEPSIAVQVAVVVCFLGAYIGGPITAALLSRRTGARHGCLWAVLAFLVPVIALPIIAFWKIRLVTAPNVPRLQSKRSVEDLLKALRDDRVGYTPANAAHALAEIGGEETADALTAALRDPQGFVRAAAADGLAQMAVRPEETAFCSPAVELLIALLQDPDANVRAAASRALGFIGDGRGTEPLTKCLADRDPYVRRTVAQALSRLGAGPGAEAAAGQVVAATETPEEAPGPAAPVSYPADWTPAPSGTSKLARISMICGIGTWFVLPVIGALAAVITGHMARREIRRSHEQLGGGWQATLGMVLGYVQLAIAIPVGIVMVAALISAARSGGGDAAGRSEIIAVARTRPAVVATAAAAATATPQPVRAADTPTSSLWATATEQARRATPTTARATAVPTPTPQTAPTVGPQPAAPVAAAASAAEVAARMPLAFLDTFDSNTHAWPVGAQQGSGVSAVQSMDGGKYQVTLDGSQGAHLSFGPGDSLGLTDFFAAVDVQQLSGSADSGCGVEFRVRDMNNRYVFFVWPAGYYALIAQQDGQWAAVIPPTATTAFRQGESNRLAVAAEGPRVEMFINDQLVAEWNDPQVASGAVLLAAEGPQAGGGVSYEFDNFELRSPDAVLTLPAFGGTTGSTPTAAAVPATATLAPTAEVGPTAAPTSPPVRQEAPTAAPTVAPSATPAPARRASPTAAAAAACPNPNATILFPPNGAPISGIVPFIGSANVENLAYYKIEYRPAGTESWNYLTQVDGQRVKDDKLIEFHSTTIPPGAYDFRLIVVDTSGNYPPPCEITLTVRR